MNTCIKTGCDISLVDSPGNVYRGDAFYFDEFILFKVREAIFRPDIEADFIITGEHLEIDGVLLARINRIALKSKDIVEMWQKWYPELLDEINVEL